MLDTVSYKYGFPYHYLHKRQTFYEPVNSAPKMGCIEKDYCFLDSMSSNQGNDNIGVMLVFLLV